MELSPDTMPTAAPELNRMIAKQRDWAIKIRQDTAILGQIADVLQDQPFHLIHPESFAHNLQDFQQVLRQNQVNGAVYYGKKANKAGAWLREIVRCNGAVDIASVPEFIHVLANGLTGAQIGVTGAAKSNELLWLSACHGAIVAIDALDELERALIYAKEVRPMRILLRVLPPQFPNSRFGFNPQDLRIALQRCVENSQHLIMAGFSFHLDGYAVAPRAQMAATLIDQCLEARKLGLPASSISIGGGFACSYVGQEDWESFKHDLSPEQFHSGKNFSHFYPYYQTPVGAEMLEAILQSPKDSTTIAKALKAAAIELYLEPGRALLDGAGLSVFPVQGFKQNDEHGIITVSGLSMSLSEQWKNSEFLPSPFLVQRGAARPQHPVRAAIGGSSCMEYDVLTWRKIAFAATPRYGDLILYPNTAGYQMDKNESTFHQLALPKKIVVQQHNDSFVWSMDQ